MKIQAVYEMAKQTYQQFEDEYYFIGLRFEDKDREIGEECEWSKHNPDREDERDFPAFGSDEFETLPELRGTSAWNLADERVYNQVPQSYMDREAQSFFPTDHCYVVAGRYTNTHDDADEGEIVIEDATVIAKIF